MTRLEKLCLVLFIDAILTYWAAQAGLDSGGISANVRLLAVLLLAVIFVALPSRRLR